MCVKGGWGYQEPQQKLRQRSRFLFLLRSESGQMPVLVLTCYFLVCQNTRTVLTEIEMTMMISNKMCCQAPEDPSAKPQVKANLGTLMGVYLPTIQVGNSNILSFHMSMLIF